MDNHFPHAFGWALKPAREAAGLTIRQLADKAGIHWVTVSALENRRKEPTTRTLWRLANALEVEFRFDGSRWSTGPVGCFESGSVMTPDQARQIVEGESRDPGALLEAGRVLLQIERGRRHCDHFGPISRFCGQLDRFVEEDEMPTGRVHKERDELRKERDDLRDDLSKSNAKLRRARAAIRALWAEACAIGDLCGQGVGDETKLVCELVVGEKLSDEPWKEG